VDASFNNENPACKLPLVVYSHGSQAWGGSNSPVLRQLVAQGWVAAAPDHLGNTLADNIDPRPVSFSLTRVADIQATINAIENLPESDPLYGRVDTSKVLVVGHSYGGQTSWLFSGPTLDSATLNQQCDAGTPACTDAERAAFELPMTDPRVVAVMPLDGFAGSDIVAPEGWESADLPILYLSQAGDDTAFKTASSTNLIWGSVEGSCHETFNNSPILCESFDKAEGLDLTAAFLTAFASVHVLGRAEETYTGVLNGTTVVDERVTLYRSESASP
jgi:predicted dienelactone hydrolase